MNEAEPEARHQNTHVHNKCDDKRKWLGILLLGLGRTIIILALISGAVVGWKHWHQGSPFPPYIQQNVTFSLYYPTPTPNRYSLDTSSMRLSNRIVFYSLKKSPYGHNITVSLQTAPADFNLKNRIPKSAIGVLTPIGTFYDLSNSKHSQFVGDTDDNVLIFINAQDRLSSTEVSTLLNNLKRYN